MIVSPLLYQYHTTKAHHNKKSSWKNLHVSLAINLSLVAWFPSFCHSSRARQRPPHSQSDRYCSRYCRHASPENAPASECHSTLWLSQRCWLSLLPHPWWSPQSLESNETHVPRVRFNIVSNTTSLMQSTNINLYQIIHDTVLLFVSTIHTVYSRKYWRSVNLAVWPQTELLTKFEFRAVVAHSVLHHHKHCTRVYQGALLSSRLKHLVVQN